MGKIEIIRPEYYAECATCRVAGEVIEREKGHLASQSFEIATITPECSIVDEEEGIYVVEPTVEQRISDQKVKVEWGGTEIAVCPGVKAKRKI